MNGEIRKVDSRIVGGQMIQDRIVGGQPVDVSLYPFIALLMRDGGKFSCGASVLRKEYPAIILTAAHCEGAFDSDDDFVRLYASTTNDSNSIDSNIMHYEIHPYYNSTSLENDIALLWLSKDISEYNFIETVTINPTSVGEECCNSGDDLTIIGYGADCEDCDVTLTLEHVEVDYVDRATCAAAYPINWVLNTMNCAARTDSGACQGDSGGPLIRKGTNEQVGIVSWGLGCADPEYPGVYSDIGALYDWIKPFIETTVKPTSNPINTETTVKPTSDPDCCMYCASTLESKSGSGEDALVFKGKNDKLNEIGNENENESNKFDLLSGKWDHSQLLMFYAMGITSIGLNVVLLCYYFIYTKCQAAQQHSNDIENCLPHNL